MVLSFLSTYEQRELISNTLILLVGLGVFFTLFTRVVQSLVKKNTTFLSILSGGSIFLTFGSIVALLFVEYLSPVETEKIAYKADLHINLEEQVSQIVESSKETMIFHQENSIPGLDVFDGNTEHRKIRTPLPYQDGKDMVIWGDAVSKQFIRLTLEAFGKQARTTKSKRISIIPHDNTIATLDINYKAHQKAPQLFADLLDSCRVLKAIQMYSGSCTIPTGIRQQVREFLNTKEVSPRHPEDRYLMLCPYTFERKNFSVSSCLDLRNVSEVTGAVVVSIKKLPAGMALGMTQTVHGKS